MEEKWVEIVDISLIGDTETIDISISGDNLFFANNILTHNSGSTHTDVGMEDTSESFGLPATLDLYLAITQSDELKESGKYLFKQLKNRMGDPATNMRFVVGVDKPKMRLYDVEQGDIMHDDPVQETKPQPFSKKPSTSKFAEFK